MTKESKLSPNFTPRTEEEIRGATIGELKPLSTRILIADYDPRWPELFAREADRIRSLIGGRAVQIEHAGSTSVSGLAAKPIIDLLLAVTDSAEEDAYVPDLRVGGYVLRIREPGWHEHRMFKGPDTDINLHVFTRGCPEIDRMLMFRDWLRRDKADRDLYASTKLALAQRDWKYVQNYADAKSLVIEQIMSRASRQDAPNRKMNQTASAKLEKPYCDLHKTLPGNSGKDFVSR